MSRKIAISTIVAKIQRDKIQKVSTKLYDELDPNYRAVVERSIDLLSDEQLILCYYFSPLQKGKKRNYLSPIFTFFGTFFQKIDMLEGTHYLNADYWWVITNLRILVCENELVDSYLFDNIDSIRVDDIFVSGVSNSECNRIQLILDSGQVINLNLEYHTWGSVASLLQFLIFPRSN